MTLSSTTAETNVRDVEYVPLYWWVSPLDILMNLI